MSLKAKVDSLDEVEAEYHGLYEKKGEHYVLLPIEGLKSTEEFDVVHRGLAKERNEHKATKATLKAFDGITPKDVADLREQVASLEAALTDGTDPKKAEAVIAQKVRAATGPLERQIADLTTAKGELEGVVTGYKQRETQGLVRDAIGTAARTAKVRDSAVDDVVALGAAIFEVNDEGKVVTKDGVGVVPGMDATSWLTDARPKKPHWWPDSAGGGAGGGAGGTGGVNPWSAAGWNMTKQGEIARQNMGQAERLAAAAGSRVGAIEPPTKA